MKLFYTVFLNLIWAVLKVIKPGGSRGLVAENLVLKQQLMALSRKRNRAPNLTSLDRIVFAIGSVMINPSRLPKLAAVVSHQTLLKFHRAMTKRKYSKLFSAKNRKKPGPKGPSKELIILIVSIKQKNNLYGCPKIAMLATELLGRYISEDLVCSILKKHYFPNPGEGPSWLTSIGKKENSLWSLDLFRCESIFLKSYWVLVVMDQYTRKLVGFEVHQGNLDGSTVCSMFQKIISRSETQPKHLSSDNDPLFRFSRWEANLRILDVREIKTVPNVPFSHPFVERLIGSIRRECLDRQFFYNSIALAAKLQVYQEYFNEARVHYSLEGTTPFKKSGRQGFELIDLSSYRWKSYCNGLFQIPIPA